MDGVCDHSPYEERIFLGDLDRAVGCVVRNEPCALSGRVEAELLDGELTVDTCYHKIAALCVASAIDNDNVTVDDPCVVHGVTLYAGIERGVGMRDKFVDDIYTFAGMVVSR